MVKKKNCWFLVVFYRKTEVTGHQVSFKDNLYSLLGALFRELYCCRGDFYYAIIIIVALSFPSFFNDVSNYGYF